MKFYSLEKLSVYNPMILEPVSRTLALPKSAKKFGIHPISDNLFVFRSGSMEIFFNKQREEAAEKTLSVLVKKPDIAHRVHRELIKNSLEMKKECDRISKQNLSKLKQRQILKEYKILENLQFKVHSGRCLGWLLETKFEILSRYLFSEIKKIIDKKKLNLNPTLAFSSLVEPTRKTLAFEEKTELLKIAKRIKSQEDLERITPKDEIYKKLNSHLKKYFYISYGQEGPGLTMNDVLLELKSVLRQKEKPDLLLKNLQRELTLASKKKREIMKKLRPPKKLCEMIKIASDISYTKLFTKYYQFYLHSCLDKILREAGKRFIISLPQMRFLLPQELKALLSGKRINRNELNERRIFSVFYRGAKDFVFVFGRSAEKFLKKFEIQEEKMEIKEVKEIKGQIAYLGRAQGKVKIVNKSEEMSKMEEGDVLVSEMTVPEIITAMKKAAAIVTDEGGITCHAAIVSRELKIPCLIGTKIATKVLRDGQLVEVDATKGLLRLLE